VSGTAASEAAPTPRGGSGRTARRVQLAALGVLVIVLTATLLVVGPFALGDGSAGSRASDYASGRYAKLVVEVDWMVDGSHDYRPSPLVLSFLQQRLNELLTKPGGIVVQLGNAVTATKSSYGTGDLRAVESANRGNHTGGDTAAMWILFANSYAVGGSGGGQVIGVAYSGSAIAIFAATIESASTFAVSTDAIEKITVVHEVGHLLGLVNIGTPMVTPHEDPTHRGHSSNEHSVMYWAVEGSDVVGMILGGNAPDDFDANDKADLHAIGGKP
jgi:hypothetical protein